MYHWLKRGVWNCRITKWRGQINGIWWNVFWTFFHIFAKRRKSVEKMNHWKKNRHHRMSKIVTSAHARCMMWCVNFVCSKDVQKQLTWTSLKIKYYVIKINSKILVSVICTQNLNDFNTYRKMINSVISIGPNSRTVPLRNTRTLQTRC